MKYKNLKKNDHSTENEKLRSYGERKKEKKKKKERKGGRRDIRLLILR